MAELSVSISEDAITIVSEMPITLPKRWLHPELVAAFCKANYNVQGSVGYQSWLAGVFAGLALVIGPDGVPFSCAGEVDEPILDVSKAGAVPIVEQILSGELTAASEETRGLTPPGSPESEAIVPSAESTAVVGEAIVPSAESTAVAIEETRGLTPPGSPVSEAAGAAAP